MSRRASLQINRTCFLDLVFCLLRGAKTTNTMVRFFIFLSPSHFIPPNITTIIIYMCKGFCPSSPGWATECPIHTVFALWVSLSGLGFLPFFSSSAITLATHHTCIYMYVVCYTHVFSCTLYMYICTLK